MFVNTDSTLARTERHLQVLQELGELGMKLARAVTEQAVRQAEGAEVSAPGDPGLAFSRIARAVRMTIALEAKLAEELQAKAERAEEDAAEQAQAAARAPYAEREATIRRAVSRAIRLDVHDEEDEELLDALEDHLDDWSRDARFLDRPMGELVQRICNELGVTANPSLWEDDDWAIEESRLAPREARGKGEGEGSAGVSAAPPRSSHDPPRAGLHRTLRVAPDPQSLRLRTTILTVS